MPKLRISGGCWLVFAAWLVVLPSRLAGADASMKITLAELDQLAQQYKEEGLPMPPADAPMMCVFASSWSQKENGEDTPQYLIGFRLKTGEGKSKPGTFLVGTEMYEPEISGKESETPPAAIDPGKPLPANLEKEWWNGPTFPVNTWLAIAVQCHIRGYHHLAEQIFERGLAGDVRFGGPTAVNNGNGWVNPQAGRNSVEAPANGKLGDSLAPTAWNHWMNASIEPGTDRAAILAHMEKLLADHPILAGDAQRDFIKSLQLTLKPSGSKPGTTEALIDELTESSSPKRGRAGDETGDSAHDKLELLGFEAVPALIAHLDDQRLTRIARPQINNFPAQPLYVKNETGELLLGLARPALGDKVISREFGAPPDAGQMREWWEKARVMGEEDYVYRHIYPAKKQENYDNVDETCLRIIAARYPRRLGGIYLRLLKERPDLDAHDITEAISKSESIGRDEKLRLLHAGLENSELRQRERAIYGLLKVDPKEAEARIVIEINKLPADVDKPYWTCPESIIPHLVMKTNSPAVWEAFLRAAKRAKVGLRMELMEPMDYSYAGNSQRKERLAFLAAFLDDEAVRIITDKNSADGRPYDGPCAGFHFFKLTVQNFAAMQIAGILGVDGYPDEKWTSAQWKKYRASVREALAKVSI